MGIKGQEKGRSLCSKFTRVDEQHLGGHSHSGDAQGVDISLWTLSLQEFFAWKGVASREAEIFFLIIKTQIVDLEIRRTMKRQRSNFVQRIIFECLLGGLGILSDARKSEESH